MSLVQAVVNLIPVAIDWIVRSLALATPVALWYRFWWGSKSQVSFRQLPDPRDRYWSYGSTDGDHWWGNYAHVIAVNRGWWTGLLWDITLEEVTFDDNQTVTEACDETVKIEIDTYAEGESERIDLGNPHQRVERSIPGRDIAHLKLAPFLSPDGDLAKHAEESDEAEFEFVAKVQDNKRTDTVPFTVTMDVSDVDFDD
jgi:hypothetical protein